MPKGNAPVCIFKPNVVVVIFYLGSRLQGQTRMAKVKSACNSLIIGPRILGCETDLQEVMG